MKQKKSTRREFIATATAAAAAFATGCISNEFVDRIAKEGRKPGDYPVVVIGSGMGGLASALYLSKAGFPVTVLEQHRIPGGYATAFTRGDYTFDVSLHFFSLEQELYDELGLEGKIERVPLQMRRRIIKNDRTIVIPDLSPEKYIETICATFPGEKEGIRAYHEFCLGLYDELMRFSEKAERGYVFIPLMPFRYPKMWEVRDMSYADLLDRYTRDASLRTTLSAYCGIVGLPPSTASGFMIALLVGHMMRNGTYYFKSRSQDLSNALAGIIREQGGTLLFNKNVTKILTEKNGVTGVQTDDGTTYPARIVVSNASAPDTFGTFLSHEKKAARYMEKLSAYHPSISCFLIWLGLRGDVRTILPEHSVTIESGLDVETDFENYLKCDAQRCPIFLALYDNYYKGYSKPGTSTLTVMMLSGYEPWRRFEKDYFAGNREAYNQEKTRIARTLIERVEKKAIPGLSSMIRVMEASTPLTNRRFTRNPEGAIYGYPASIDNAYMNRIKNSTPIRGLYLSSGWGNNPGSYTGGILNGRDVYRLIMKEM